MDSSKSELTAKMVKLPENADLAMLLAAIRDLALQSELLNQPLQSLDYVRELGLLVGSFGNAPSVDGQWAYVRERLKIRNIGTLGKYTGHPYMDEETLVVLLSELQGAPLIVLFGRKHPNVRCGNTVLPLNRLLQTQAVQVPTLGDAIVIVTGARGSSILQAQDAVALSVEA